MSERRPTNSELRLQRLEDEEKRERQEREERGILELFREEDEPAARDEDRQPEG